MDDAKISNHIFRLEQVTSTLNQSEERFKVERKKLEENINKGLDFLNSLELLGTRTIKTIEESIPNAVDKMSKNCLDSIKLNITKELQLEMDKLKLNISQYASELRGLKQDVRSARGITTKYVALICGSSFLASAFTAFFIYSWGWYHLSDSNLHYLKVGTFVDTKVKSLHLDIQQHFWKKFDVLGNKIK